MSITFKVGDIVKNKNNAVGMIFKKETAGFYNICFNGDSSAYYSVESEDNLIKCKLSIKKIKTDNKNIVHNTSLIRKNNRSIDFIRRGIVRKIERMKLTYFNDRIIKNIKIYSMKLLTIDSYVDDDIIYNYDCIKNFRFSKRKVFVYISPLNFFNNKINMYVIIKNLLMLKYEIKQKIILTEN